MAKPGPTNSILDVDGIRIGHAHDAKLNSGTTVILCPDANAAGVDVRGGAPGLRDTELLSPENIIGRADAIFLSGGSVFGLAAGDGIATALSAQGIGIGKGKSSPKIPIVCGAILFDLANGGDKNWDAHTPYFGLGQQALENAQNKQKNSPQLGKIGAAYGAKAGRVNGGIGSASLVLDNGITVAALVAVNSIGSVFMPDGKTFWAQPFAIGDELGGQKMNPNQPVAVDPLPADCKPDSLAPGTNTTIGVIATSARLDTAECKRISLMGHDGYARAIRPVHTPFDGDTIFSISGGSQPLSDGHKRAIELTEIGAAAADCMARAIARGVYEANR